MYWRLNQVNLTYQNILYYIYIIYYKYGAFYSSTKWQNPAILPS